MANEIQITVNAKDKASAKLRGIQGQAGKLGSMMGTALKAGAIAGGVALAGAGTAAVKMGLDFGKGMAEVKTLLPDLSEKGFGKLKEGVLALSKEMGIATSDMVPALYQAISAGVPPENVLSFLKENAKLAIGGVADLETAVDLTTTALNAFGLEAKDTGRVSDILFTGVKLGKTTIAELGASLFQVAPAAAAAGVPIEEVTAALATLTASGTPTAQASTQIRQALVEMGKEGTKANQAFQDIAGVGFRQFMEEGGSMGDAMEMMAKKAEEQGVAISDLFGSVEAGMGVQVLAGKGFDKFTESLEATANATGATDKAFETMSQTASFKLNKAINIVKVSLTEVGAKALPVMVKGIEALAKEVKKFLPTVKDLGKQIGAFLLPAVDTLSDAWDNLWPILQSYVIPVLEKVGRFLLEHKPLLIGIAAAILLLVAPWLAVAAAIVVVLAKWDEISAFFIGIGKTIEKFVKDVIQKVGDFPIVGEIIKDTVRTAKVFIETQLRIIKALFEAALDTIINTFRFWKAIFTGDWDAAWNAVKDQAKVIWDLLSNLFGIALDAVKAIFDSKLQMVMGIGSDLGNLIVDAAKKVWEGLKRKFEIEVGAIGSWLGGAADAVKNIGLLLGNLILAGAGAAWGGLTGAFSTAVNAVAEWATGAAATIRGIGASVGDSIMRGIDDGIRAAEGFVKGALNFLITLVEKGINLVIGLINAIPSVTLPFGGGTIGIPHIDPVSIPRLHRGGEVLRTGLAVVEKGERFTRAGAAGGADIVLQGPLLVVEGSLMGNEVEAERFARDIWDRVRRQARGAHV